MDIIAIAQHGVTGLAVLLGLIIYELVKQRLSPAARQEQSQRAATYSALGKVGEVLEDVAAKLSVVPVMAARIEELHRWGQPTEDGSPLRRALAPMEARLTAVEREQDACRRVCRERGAELDSQRARSQ